VGEGDISIIMVAQQKEYWWKMVFRNCWQWQINIFFQIKITSLFFFKTRYWRSW